MKLILSCEHGGNDIPPAWKANFSGKESILNSHRGYDPGTDNLFDFLRPLAQFGIRNKVSRLLIEFNRSKHHPHLFSEWSKHLSAIEKDYLIKEYYQPYRNQLISEITKLLSKEDTSVLHLSIHSFTPELNGKQRKNDIGLLFDPKRIPERDFSKQFKALLLKNKGAYSVRFNYPYLGTADGLTTALRNIFPENYLGIELEINQKWLNGKSFPKDLKQLIYRSVAEILQDRPPSP